MKATNLIKPIIFSLLVFSAVALLAAAPPPPPPPGQPGDQSVPVGSGLLVLAAIGVAYAAKKTYDFRKNLRSK